MPIGDLLAQISGEVQPSLPSTSQPAKRKAEEDLRHNGEKVVRREQAVAKSSRSVLQMERSQSLSTSVSKTKSSLSSINLTSSNPVQPSLSTGPNPAPIQRFDPAKPPKKGSYAEIMARGKAAQANLGQVGKISHKPIEKPLSKRERQELAEQQRASESRKKGGPKPLRDSRNGIRVNNGKVSKPVRSEPLAAEQKTKKAATATTGYTGTARPNPALAKRAKPSSSGQGGSSRSPNKQNSSTSGRYTYASEEDDEAEEEDEEDEEDYPSDASSDMEAAVFEVDEEEERAARIARKEDNEALKEENRLKREKELKREKLAAMAKSRQKH